MAKTLTKDEISRLVITERLTLIAELWDSIPPEQVPFPESHRQMLDEALLEHTRGTNGGQSWEAVRDELFPKK